MSRPKIAALALSSLVSSLKIQKDRLAKTRDYLVTLRDQAQEEFEDADAAIELLTECIGKLSEHH